MVLIVFVLEAEPDQLCVPAGFLTFAELCRKVLMHSAVTRGPPSFRTSYRGVGPLAFN